MLADKLQLHQMWLANKSGGIPLALQGPYDRLDLSNLNLERAQFINFEGSGHIFNGANLRGASFIGASSRRPVQNANVAMLPDWDAWSFVGANLQDTNFYGSQLCRADFTNTDLSNSKFCYSDISDAILERANISSCDFANANLIGVDLSGCNARETRLQNCLFKPRFFNCIGNNLEIKNIEIGPLPVTYTNRFIQIGPFIAGIDDHEFWFSKELSSKIWTLRPEQSSFFFSNIDNIIKMIQRNPALPTGREDFIQCVCEQG